MRKTINDALIVLNGRYGIFNGYHKVAFVNWGNGKDDVYSRMALRKPRNSK